MGLDAKKTAVVLLGASTFPRSEQFSPSEAFSMAKKRILGYFQEKLLVDNVNILDLFDSDLNADDQDQRIGNFIEHAVSLGVQDIFLYYVGHGSFTPADNSFYLALRGTRDNNPGVSSLTIRTLSNTIIQAAHLVRTFVILDCCFAAAAGTGFMGAEAAVPAAQLKEVFASKGVALMCATSKDLPALIVEGRQITMFTEGLNEALIRGDSSIGSRYLSLRNIHALTYNHIRRLNGAQAVKPEILSPVQLEGDIADMPTFENFAFAEAKYDILARKRSIESEIIQNNLTGLGNLFIDFVRNYDETGLFNIESVLLCSECNELVEEKNTIGPIEFRERRREMYIQVIKMVNQIIENNIKAKSAI